MNDDTLAHLTFLSHLRRGLATTVTQPAGASGPLRPAFPVQVELNDGSLAVSTAVELYGPGDVTGIDLAVVVRTDPVPGTADFEPNYFPLVEFAAPDFPWRFTPSREDAAGRLRPWIVLAVLAEGEFRRVPGLQQPLPVVVVAEPRRALPDLGQSWAWAHVQLADRADQADSIEADVAGRLRETPELLVSRLLCPRRLLPNQAYHAFLLPAMEAGRRAGLEMDPGADGLAPAWTSASVSDLELPVYYEWSFRTGERGDFEELVRRLEARQLDERVGVRLMEVSQPGYNIQGPAEPAGLEGALKSLRTTSTPPPDQAFKDALADLLNLPERLQEAGGEAAPRTIAPPIYGRWHAEQKIVGPENPPWLGTLNLDPRHRGAAGLGARVVQEGQESLMASAWAQIGAVKEANQVVFQGQLGVLVSLAMYDKHIVNLPDDRLIALAQPVHARITGSPTVSKVLADSRVPSAAVESAFRRAARPRGSSAKRIGMREPGRFVSRLDAVEIAGAGPAPARPDGIVALGDAAERFLPSHVPVEVRRLLPRLPILLFILAAVLAVGAAIAFDGSTIALGLVLAVAALAAGLIGWALRRPAARWASALNGTKARLTARVLTSAPPRSTFTITAPGEPPPAGPTPRPSRGPATNLNNPGLVAPGFAEVAGDSPEAARFREAAVTVQERLHIAVGAPPVRAPLNVVAVADVVRQGLNPRATIGRRVLGRFQDGRAAPVDEDGLPEIEEIMGAPTFPHPMYEPLRDLSQDYLLPGLEHVPNNSVGLLKTNPAFVEAYMLGLNHEMARELLWREYPTDQRGSYFRQFWDVRGVIPPAAGDLEHWQESLRDIKPVHTWDGELGENRPGDSDPEREQLVLLVRGDLLRKYPTAVVYAEKARRTGPGGAREPDSATVKVPLFRGTLPPDVTFVGFDLTRDQVVGSDDPQGDQGWFFIIQQQHAELRFGLDAAEGIADGRAESWSALSWGHLSTADTFDDLNYIDLDSTLPDTGGILVGLEDPLVNWGERASDMAYITLQQPFRAAIHGSLMVPESDDGENGDA